MAETQLRYQVSDENGVVHVAYGILEEDMKRGGSLYKGGQIIYVAFACDTTAEGGLVPMGRVFKDRAVTCMACLADTRHQGD